MGDAGTLHPPFTGSGVFKAISNAVELAAALAAKANVDDALAPWNKRQLRHAASFVRTAELFEQSLVFSMPDLATLPDEQCRAYIRATWADANDAPPASPPSEAHAG